MNCRCGAPLTKDGVCAEVAAYRAPRGATHQPASPGGPVAVKRPRKVAAKKKPAAKKVAAKKR